MESMKRYLLILGVLVLTGVCSCHSRQDGGVLVARAFPTMSWERFDYVEETLTVEKPTTYDLDLDVVFDEKYDFDYFSTVFTVFDASGRPLRSKNYKFTVKDRDGSWKSELKDGTLCFRFPLNSQLSLNEPGTYTFQLENRMPITPLTGIREISIVSK